MNNCYICDIIINNENPKTIGIKTIDNKIICSSCKEINDFLYEEKKSSIKKTIEEKQFIKSGLICIKCKKQYDNKICTICNIENPLYKRKKKNNKRNKKKN